MAWDAYKLDWIPPFVGLIRSRLNLAKTIDNHLCGVTQLVIGEPIWETYLKGQPTACLRSRSC